MNIGSISIILAFIAILFSGYYYFRAMRLEMKVAKSINEKKNPTKKIKVENARIAFYVMVLLTTIASVFLFYLFLTHQFT